MVGLLNLAFISNNLAFLTLTVQVPEQLQHVRHGRGAAGGGRPVRLLAGGCAAGEKIFV